MRILQLHNGYQQRGGEDVVVEREAELLRSHGHEVEALVANNSGLKGGVGAAANAVWSRSSQRLVRQWLARFQPDIVHVHNTFAVLSPSVYWTLADARVPVVQTLHNYRTVCANSLLMRDGRICD